MAKKRRIFGPEIREGIDPSRPLIDQFEFTFCEYEDGWNDPVTPDVIKQRIAEIQASWTEEQERERRTGTSARQDYSVPDIVLEDYIRKEID